MQIIRGCLAAIAVSIAVIASGQSQQPGSRDFLKKYLSFSEADIVELDAGQLITKLPKVSDQREVAAFAVVRVNALPEQLALQFHDIVQWKKGESVPQIGKFSEKPTV